MHHKIRPVLGGARNLPHAQTPAAPKALKDYGLSEEHIPEAARLILTAIPASHAKPPLNDSNNSSTPRIQEQLPRRIHNRRRSYKPSRVPSDTPHTEKA